MKTPFLYRFVIFCLLALPFLSKAGESYSATANGLSITDSIPQRFIPQKQDDKKQDDKKQDDKKARNRKPEEKKPEIERPDIKEVPKSRRLPKPTAVVDKVIRRPPVKVVRPGVVKRH